MATTAEKKQTNKPMTLDNFKVTALAEIQGKKEALLTVIKENPYVAITDNTTWEQAKKNRTALRTARTETDKEGKAILLKVKQHITEPVKNIYSEFIGIISPVEERQQAEVKRYEDIKETERLERDRIEEDRKEKHRATIKNHFESQKARIEQLNFADLEKFELDTLEVSQLEEFEDQYIASEEMLKIRLNEKTKQLQEKEDLRIREEELANERKIQEAVNKMRDGINTFYAKWGRTIDAMEFKDIDTVSKNLVNETPLSCGSLQDEYSERRASLISKLEERAKFLKQQEEQRIATEKFEAEKKALEEEKIQIRTEKRKQQLIGLGYNEDLTYVIEGPHFEVDEEDLLLDEENWTGLVNNLKDYYEQKNDTNEIEVIAEEVGSEPEFYPTEEVGAEPQNTFEHYPTEETLNFAMYLTGDDEDTIVAKFHTWMNEKYK